MSPAKQPTPAALRRKQQTRVKEIAKAYGGNDPFGGLGDWDPSGAPKTAIARVIAHLAGMKIPKPKPAVAKEKTIKRAPKPKAAPKPKKGKKIGKVNEVMLKSPGGHVQSIPLVPDLRELLLDGWVIVGDDTAVNEAYSFLNFNPKELQSA